MRLTGSNAWHCNDENFDVYLFLFKKWTLHKGIFSLSPLMLQLIIKPIRVYKFIMAEAIPDIKPQAQSSQIKIGRQVVLGKYALCRLPRFFWEILLPYYSSLINSAHYSLLFLILNPAKLCPLDLQQLY